jgi:predicted transcriptional regulator
MLEITQGELADAAKLGLSTVVDFEKQRRQISSEAATAIRLALERAGVQMIDENGGGPGVRLRRPSQARRK